MGPCNTASRVLTIDLSSGVASGIQLINLFTVKRNNLSKCYRRRSSLWQLTNSKRLRTNHCCLRCCRCCWSSRCGTCWSMRTDSPRRTVWIVQIQYPGLSDIKSRKWRKTAILWGHSGMDVINTFAAAAAVSETVGRRRSCTLKRIVTLNKLKKVNSGASMIQIQEVGRQLYLAQFLLKTVLDLPMVYETVVLLLWMSKEELTIHRNDHRVEVLHFL